MKSVKQINIFTVLLLLLISSSAVISHGTEHNHVFTELYTVRPTCTEGGYKVMACDCGEFCEAERTDPLGHNFSKDIVCYKKATCLEKGEAGRYCVRCYAKKDIIYYGKTSHVPETVIIKAGFKNRGESREECRVCKKLYSRYKIYKISSVRLETKAYTYDGKVKTPTVTVKDEKGNKLVKNTDYTLRYQNGRRKTGIYSVTVTFKGDYEGKKVLYFSIKPERVKNITAVPSLSSVFLSWDKSKGADGYEIYLKGKKLLSLKNTDKLSCKVSKINGKKLKSGTDYIFVIKSYKNAGEKKIYSSQSTVKVSTRPQKAKIKKIVVSSGKVSVTAFKQSCHGYEFLLSTNKSFKNPKKQTVKGENSVKYTFKNLVRGRKYFVKVRAYTVYEGVKYYGYYSDIKTVKA